MWKPINLNASSLALGLWDWLQHSFTNDKRQRIRTLITAS